MTQRYLKGGTVHNPVEFFKQTVIAAVLSEPEAINDVAATITEVAGLTDRPSDPDVGKSVVEYLAYRSGDGPEPEWHRSMADQQERDGQFPSEPE